MKAPREPGDERRAYRCPVCSHADHVSLTGSSTTKLRCSHCDTLLEVVPKGTDSVAVTVAEEEGPGRA